MDYFKELFDDAGPEGEEELIASLGTPKEAAHDILSDLLDKKVNEAPAQKNDRQLLHIALLALLVAPIGIPVGIGILMALILASLWVGDHPALMRRNRNQVVTLDRAISDENELITELEDLLGAQVRSADTGNLLLDLAAVEDLGLRFDPRYGLTGGEDPPVTRQLPRAGGVIRFAAGAVVTKRVPAARARTLARPAAAPEVAVGSESGLEFLVVEFECLVSGFAYHSVLLSQ